MSNEKATKKTILVIDDDITSLDIVSYLFEEAGFEVKRCADGFSAVEQVKEMSPDVIVVDLMMPGINGVETVRQIRQLGHHAVPIIAFTAVDDVELHEEARKVGCNKVLTKPCRSDKLIQHIQELL